MTDAAFFIGLGVLIGAAVAVIGEAIYDWVMQAPPRPE